MLLVSLVAWRRFKHLDAAICMMCEIRTSVTNDWWWIMKDAVKHLLVYLWWVLRLFYFRGILVNSLTFTHSVGAQWHVHSPRVSKLSSAGRVGRSGSHCRRPREQQLPAENPNRTMSPSSWSKEAHLLTPRTAVGCLPARGFMFSYARSSLSNLQTAVCCCIYLVSKIIGEIKDSNSWFPTEK